VTVLGDEAGEETAGPAAASRALPRTHPARDAAGTPSTDFQQVLAIPSTLSLPLQQSSLSYIRVVSLRFARYFQPNLETEKSHQPCDQSGVCQQFSTKTCSMNLNRVVHAVSTAFAFNSNSAWANFFMS